MSLNIGKIETFPHPKADKAQVLKILEESAEVFSAWEDGEESKVLDECADVIQAVANLARAYGYLDMSHFIRACEKRNRERGRYEG